jgi:hypothetical protein
MSTDLEKLLGDASGDPTTPIDAEALWAAGRRRRLVRRAGAAGGTAVLVLAVALVGVNLDRPGTPDIAPLTASEADDPSPAPGLVDDETAQELAREAERQRMEELRDQAEAARRAAQEEAAAREAAAAAEAEAQAQARAQEGEAEAEAEAETEAPTAAPAPTPDAARLADPCAAHQGREMDAFIDVVGPVRDQQVGASIDLVGCSNVYEATVRYRLVGDAGVLRDSFTTAGCGNGCVGEFRASISVPASAGALTLEVFWDSPKDGSEQDKVTIPLGRS